MKLFVLFNFKIITDKCSTMLSIESYKTDQYTYIEWFFENSSTKSLNWPRK